MKKLTLIFLTLMLLLSLASCAIFENSKSDNESENGKNIVLTTAYDFYKSEEEVYEINSEHCPLYFPTKWKDNVKIDVYEDETMFKVSFYSVFGSDTIPLYDFIFGESSEGYILGAVRTDEGLRDLYLVDLSSSYDGQLSESDELTYFEMCEGVNDIISHLVYVNGLALAN